MIKLDEPHMVINDSRSPTRYVMRYNWLATEKETIEGLLTLVAGAARSAPSEGKLAHLIINSHGNGGYLQLGKDGLDRSNVSMFRVLRGLVDKIWLTGCLVAHITPSIKGSSNPDFYNGHLFCAEMAIAAQCYVVASTENQRARDKNFYTYPYGCLDSYEGLLLSYDPSGNISWQHRYPGRHFFE